MAFNTTTQGRFCASGPMMDNFHIVDLYLYDSSLFANSVIVEDRDYTVIVDTGTSSSTGSLLNYINFNEINTKNVLIVPTHHHFDHTGGIKSVIDYLEKKGSNVQVVANKKMVPFLTDPSNYRDIAAKSFSNMMGMLDPLPTKYVFEKDNENKMELGDNWDLEILKTPGHCVDHVSPLFTNAEGYSFCVFGEALGINLKRGMKPIPASSAPCFKKDDYLASLDKLSEYQIDSGLFSHFGGVDGEENVGNAIVKAKSMYYEFRDKIVGYHSINSSTKFITDKIFNEYEEDIATQSLNFELGKQLAFTIVYGILMDEGLK